MPRFKWNDPQNGRVINRYIDMICRDYPAIAKDVVKHGIGDLDSWFSNGNNETCQVGSANCGCLVGTTALVAMKRFKKEAKEVDRDEYNGAVVLYDLIVKKTKRDVSKYNEYNPWGERENIDPLMQLISTAGEVAAEESYDGLDYPDGTSRQQQVIDHLENRIRRNLNMPYPKSKARKHASA